MAKDKISSLHDLFIHELQHLYSGEEQLIEALPKMVKASSNANLIKAFQDHLEETKKQKERLEKAGDILGKDLSGRTCKGMEGLISEGEGIVKADADENVRDAGLIAAAQKVEHYEIAGYGTASYYASLLGYNEVADLLNETLEEEKKADSKLNSIAVSSVNAKAEKA